MVHEQTSVLTRWISCILRQDAFRSRFDGADWRGKG